MVSEWDMEAKASGQRDATWLLRPDNAIEVVAAVEEGFDTGTPAEVFVDDIDGLAVEFLLAVSKKGHLAASPRATFQLLQGRCDLLAELDRVKSEADRHVRELSISALLIVGSLPLVLLSSFA